MTIDEIKALLDQGDNIKIARKVGYKDLRLGSQYVSMVLNGKIKKLRGKSQKIVEEAEKMAAMNLQDREQLV